MGWENFWVIEWVSKNYADIEQNKCLFIGLNKLLIAALFLFVWFLYWKLWPFKGRMGKKISSHVSAHISPHCVRRSATSTCHSVCFSPSLETVAFLFLLQIRSQAGFWPTIRLVQSLPIMRHNSSRCKLVNLSHPLTQPKSTIWWMLKRCSWVRLAGLDGHCGGWSKVLILKICSWNVNH